MNHNLHILADSDFIRNPEQNSCITVSLSLYPVRYSVTLLLKLSVSQQQESTCYSLAEHFLLVNMIYIQIFKQRSENVLLLCAQEIDGTWLWAHDISAPYQRPDGNTNQYN